MTERSWGASGGGSPISEARLHDALSSLAAIEAAGRALAGNPPDPAGLGRAIANEVGVVRRLIDEDEAPATGQFRLWVELEAATAACVAEGLPVTTDIPRNLEVVGDGFDFRRVIRNLLDNARRHAPGSKVDISARRRDDRIVVRVEDRGPGVALHRSATIFRPGVRDEHSTTPGEGLGLAVCEELVHRMGGIVWVEPRQGGGASFAVSLTSATLPLDGEDQVGEDAEALVPSLVGVSRDLDNAGDPVELDSDIHDGDVEGVVVELGLHNKAGTAKGSGQRLRKKRRANSNKDA